jgi:hypothetical protein
MARPMEDAKVERQHSQREQVEENPEIEQRGSLEASSIVEF